jgi:hypothetical protein
MNQTTRPTIACARNLMKRGRFPSFRSGRTAAGSAELRSFFEKYFQKFRDFAQEIYISGISLDDPSNVSLAAKHSSI